MVDLTITINKPPFFNQKKLNDTLNEMNFVEIGKMVNSIANNMTNVTNINLTININCKTKSANTEESSSTSSSTNKLINSGNNCSRRIDKVTQVELTSPIITKNIATQTEQQGEIQHNSDEVDANDLLSKQDKPVQVAKVQPEATSEPDALSQSAPLMPHINPSPQTVEQKTQVSPSSSNKEKDIIRTEQVNKNQRNSVALKNKRSQAERQLSAEIAKNIQQFEAYASSLAKQPTTLKSAKTVQPETALESDTLSQSASLLPHINPSPQAAEQKAQVAPSASNKENPTPRAKQTITKQLNLSSGEANKITPPTLAKTQQSEKQSNDFILNDETLRAEPAVSFVDKPVPSHVKEIIQQFEQNISSQPKMTLEINKGAPAQQQIASQASKTHDIVASKPVTITKPQTSVSTPAIANGRTEKIETALPSYSPSRTVSQNGKLSVVEKTPDSSLALVPKNTRNPSSSHPSTLDGNAASSLELSDELQKLLSDKTFKSQMKNSALNKSPNKNSVENMQVDKKTKLLFSMFNNIDDYLANDHNKKARHRYIISIDNFEVIITISPKDFLDIPIEGLDITNLLANYINGLNNHNVYLNVLQINLDNNTFSDMSGQDADLYSVNDPYIDEEFSDMEDIQSYDDDSNDDLFYEIDSDIFSGEQEQAELDAFTKQLQTEGSKIIEEQQPTEIQTKSDKIDNHLSTIDQFFYEKKYEEDIESDDAFSSDEENDYDYLYKNNSVISNLGKVQNPISMNNDRLSQNKNDTHLSIAPIQKDNYIDVSEEISKLPTSKSYLPYATKYNNDNDDYDNDSPQLEKKTRFPTTNANRNDFPEKKKPVVQETHLPLSMTKVNKLIGKAKLLSRDIPNKTNHKFNKIIKNLSEMIEQLSEVEESKTISALDLAIMNKTRYSPSILLDDSLATNKKIGKSIIQEKATNTAKTPTDPHPKVEQETQILIKQDCAVHTEPFIVAQQKIPAKITQETQTDISSMMETKKASTIVLTPPSTIYPSLEEDNKTVPLAQAQMPTLKATTNTKKSVKKNRTTKTKYSTILLNQGLPSYITEEECNALNEIKDSKFPKDLSKKESSLLKEIAEASHDSLPKINNEQYKMLKNILNLPFYKNITATNLQRPTLISPVPGKNGSSKKKRDDENKEKKDKHENE